LRAGARFYGRGEFQVQIRISDPALVLDLIEFLGRASCVAVHRKRCTLDVELPHAAGPAQARRELELYLAAWRGLHPNVATELVDAASKKAFITG
jgi:hypothetical protein